MDLRNRKAQALLVYLALTGKRHGREKLAALLWGDRFEDQARELLDESARMFTELEMTREADLVRHARDQLE